jgi:hypothetical protein
MTLINSTLVRTIIAKATTGNDVAIHVDRFSFNSSYDAREAIEEFEKTDVKLFGTNISYTILNDVIPT